MALSDATKDKINARMNEVEQRLLFLSGGQSQWSVAWKIALAEHQLEMLEIFNRLIAAQEEQVELLRLIYEKVK